MTECMAQLQLNQWDFLPHSKGNGMQQASLPPSVQYHACNMLASFLQHLRKATSGRPRDSCPQATIRNAILAMVKAQLLQLSLESQGLNASCEPMVNSHLCQFQGSTFLKSFEFPPCLSLFALDDFFLHIRHRLGKVKCSICTAQLQLNQWDFLIRKGMV